MLGLPAIVSRSFTISGSRLAISGSLSALAIDLGADLLQFEKTWTVTLGYDALSSTLSTRRSAARRSASAAVTVS
jgi:hypothetical protein